MQILSLSLGITDPVFMWKKIFYSGLFLFFIATHTLNAQNKDFEDFNKRRAKINQRGMAVLGSWAIGNFAWSGVSLTGNLTESDKAFYQMNIYWNGFNLLLAGVGYLGSRKLYNPSASVYKNLKSQYAVEKTFLINTGLDVAYMVGGIYLQELSKNATDSQMMLEGFGKSVVLQGAFLFGFDLLMYCIHARNRHKASPFLENLQFSNHGLGLIYRF